MEQKYVNSIRNAEKSLQLADHLAYVTFPLLGEQRISLKIITELNIFAIYLINAILQYEYYFKRISLYRDARSNLETFRSSCIKPYKFSDEEVRALFDIMRLAEAHKRSPMEFVKNSNVVIMTDNMRTETINMDRIKNFIRMSKSVLGKTKERLSQSKLA